MVDDMNNSGDVPTNKNNEAEQVMFLKSAMEEAQASARAFDTKAQIVGIGYIFSIGIITTIGSWSHTENPFSFLSVFLAWLLVMAPIIFFGAVLYPSRKMAPHLGDKSRQVRRLYHVSVEQQGQINDYLSEIEKCNLKAELAYELLKVSMLRELKRSRFIRALFVSGMRFLLIFLSQIIRSSGNIF